MLVYNARDDSFTASLYSLPEASRSPGSGDYFGPIRKRNLSRARYRSMRSPGALARLRLQPFDLSRVIPPPSKFILTKHSIMGLEP